MLKPEPAFYIQIVLFVGLWWVLRRWWFEPALRVLRERATRSEGALAEARAVEAEAARLAREHAAALDRARHEAERDVQEILRAAEAEQKRTIAEATAEAERMLAEARGRIAEEVATARRELHGQVRVIARAVAEKVLGRAV
jgi:F-type H+-transporting ATPase subunit b